MLNTVRRSFLPAAWLGWQVESNWTDPLLFVAFFFVHVAQVAQAGWNNFRAMITGYEVQK